jgi:hypothetical protein
MLHISKPAAALAIAFALGAATPVKSVASDIYRDADRGPSPENVKVFGNFPIWKTVTLGTHRDVNMLREDLDSANCGRPKPVRSDPAQPRFLPGTQDTLRCALGDTANEIIGRPAFVLSKVKSSVDLAVLSVADLGFGKGATVAEVYARAQGLGLELCAAEIGPQLRLQYLNQPLGEFLRIAMNPIAAYDGELINLVLGNGGSSLVLVGSDGRPDAVVNASHRFVFVRPTQIAQPRID